MPQSPQSPLRDPFPELVGLVLDAAVASDERDLDEEWPEDSPQVMPEATAGLFRDLDAALMVEASMPTAAWTDERVVAALGAAERASRASTARGLRLAAELAARRPASSDVAEESGLSKYALDEVAVATGLARGAARGRVAEAQLVASRFPRLLDALEAGLVTLTGVRKVAELTWGITDDWCRRIDVAVLNEVGRPLVRRLGRLDLAGMLALEPDVARSVAVRATTLRLGRITRDVIAVNDPQRIADERALERDARRVGLDLARGGMAWLTAYGAEALATAAYERLDGLARGLDDPEDSRTLDQKRADVLFDLLLGRADHAPGLAVGPDQPGAPAVAPAGGWGASTVNLDVIVDHTRCAPDGGCVGEAGRLGPVTAQSLTELLDLVSTTGGRVSGGHGLPTPCPGKDHHQVHGPGPYEPSEPLKRQVRATWRRCGFPGCARPARACDLDHAVPHRLGGPTCSCNLAPACKHHHRLKHDQPKDWSAWQLVRTGQMLTWISPTGLTVHLVPDPPDPDPPAHDPPPF